MSNDLSNFIGLYPVTKTLRFELLPQGRTQEWVEKNGVLERDKMLSEDYKQMKLIIDDYHRGFINSVLKTGNNIDIDWTELAQALDAYQKSDADTRDKNKEILENVQAKHRKHIVDLLANPKKYNLSNEPGFATLFNADFIKEVLPAEFADSQDKLAVIEKFEKFTTYFTGFNENRKHMYSAEDKAGSIAYRIVNQNFPKFYQNLKLYASLKEKYPELLAEAEKKIEAVFGGEFGQDEVFKLEFYNRILSQDGIEFYNSVIGGRTEESGPSKQGLNQIFNENYQQGKLGEKAKRVRFAPLHKQILAEKSTLSFVLDKVDNDHEATTLVSDLFEKLNLNAVGESNIVCSYVDFLTGDFDYEKIYVSDTALPELSKLLTGRWDQIGHAFDVCAGALSGPVAGLTEKAADKWRKQKHFTFADIISACSAASILLPENIFAVVGAEFNSRVETAKQNSIEALSTCEKYTTTKRHLLESEANIEPIKFALENLLACRGLLKIFEVERELDREPEFYGKFDEVFELLGETVPVYNKIRNYITQKPFSEEKFKLNFEVATLASGWDVNKEKDSRCTIFLKDGQYYLGIMNKSVGNLFENVPAVEDDEPRYQKMVYKLLPGPNKMLPKVFFSKKGLETYHPSEYILEGYAAGKHKKGDNFDLDFCHDLIDFFKENIHNYPGWEVFNFQFSPTETYADISDFYKEVTQQGYSIRFIDVPESYVDALVEEGNLYLFQIYNKDFAKKSDGKKNLHTLYFENLFTPENLEKVVFKLNGEAELFYRPASIENPYKHKVGEKLVNKTYVEDGVTVHIPDAEYMEIFNHVNNGDTLRGEAKKIYDTHKNEIVKEVDHELVKDKRYTQAKYGFHVPITINFGATGSNNVNFKVLEYLHNNPDVNIIGIDRGERNLLYVTVIDQNGEILEQESLNIINGVDYHNKLVQKEAERKAGRKNWKNIGQIRQFKEGYLSLVVTEVAKLMVKHNAILVLEDLNQGFKNSRLKIETQVYQKFEKALIEKLNYFTQKPTVERYAKTDETGVGIYEPGGVAKGYQLTNKFESFEKLGKQCGFIFYVPAWNTSKIDPSTGFVNLFGSASLNYANVEASKCFFNLFDRIAYSPSDDWFEFTFTYSKFKQIRQADPTDTWTVCSYGERLVNVPNKASKGWTTVSVDPTKELKALLDASGIDYASGWDLRDAICEKFDKDSFVALYRQLKNVLQIRNSETGKDTDYILSPVKNDNGVFFDSRLVKNDSGPENADANGAYNIARKGLKMLEEFNKTEQVNGKYKLPSISKGENERWLAWAQANRLQ